MDNYRYCAEFVAAAARERGSPPGGAFRALDYGCGQGRIVGLLRGLGVEAFGCDLYYGGAGRGPQGEAEALSGFIIPMDGGIIPFPGASFDAVVSNQVIEHVENLDAALAEIRRVLKPGGVVLSVFPHRGIWREEHTGIPWLHRFRKGTRRRLLYAAAWRSLGFGRFKGGKDVLEWSRDACAWLDAWTHYRDAGEISASFARHFDATRHAEEDWLRARLGPAVRFLPAPIQRLAAWKLGGLVLVSSIRPGERA